MEAPARPESLTVIDMVDDASVPSEFSYLTGDDSEGQSTVALSNGQLAMAPESSTVVPLPRAPERQETVVTPKDVVTTAAPNHPVVSAVLPKQIRITAKTQSTVVTKDIAQAPQEVVRPETQACASFIIDD